MKIAVWRTGHPIADTVAEAVYEGLQAHQVFMRNTGKFEQSEIRDADIHIAYGILRGCAEVFRECDRQSKPWICLDRGYWKPNHYNGYYRVSLCGTQQTTGLDKLEPDYERWDKLGLDILSEKKLGLIPLVCSPTLHVEAFFRPNHRHSWWETQRFNNIDLIGDYINRPKDCERDLQDDLNKCSKVITFNSSVGWEALRQGIPVVSDPIHSIVGAYQKYLDKPLYDDSNARRDLFALMSAMQLTLDEIKSGLLWPLLQRLLSL